MSVSYEVGIGQNIDVFEEGIIQFKLKVLKAPSPSYVAALIRDIESRSLQLNIDSALRPILVYTTANGQQQISPTFNLVIQTEYRFSIVYMRYKVLLYADSVFLGEMVVNERRSVSGTLSSTPNENRVNLFNLNGIPRRSTYYEHAYQIGHFLVFPPTSSSYPNIGLNTIGPYTLMDHQYSVTSFPQSFLLKFDFTPAVCSGNPGRCSILTFLPDSSVRGQSLESQLLSVFFEASSRKLGVVVGNTLKNGNTMFQSHTPFAYDENVRIQLLFTERLIYLFVNNSRDSVVEFAQPKVSGYGSGVLLVGANPWSTGLSGIMMHLSKLDLSDGYSLESGSRQQIQVFEAGALQFQILPPSLLRSEEVVLKITDSDGRELSVVTSNYDMFSACLKVNGETRCIDSHIRMRPDTPKDLKLVYIKNKILLFPKGVYAGKLLQRPSIFAQYAPHQVTLSTIFGHPQHGITDFVALLKGN